MSNCPHIRGGLEGREFRGAVALEEPDADRADRSHAAGARGRDRQRRRRCDRRAGRRGARRRRSCRRSTWPRSSCTRERRGGGRQAGRARPRAVGRRAAGPPDTPAARALRDGAVVTTLERAVGRHLARRAGRRGRAPGHRRPRRRHGAPARARCHHARFRRPAARCGCRRRACPRTRRTVTVAWGLNEPSLEPAGPGAQLMLDGKPVDGAVPLAVRRRAADRHHGAAADAARGPRRAPLARRRRARLPPAAAVPAGPEAGEDRGAGRAEEGPRQRHHDAAQRR